MKNLTRCLSLILGTSLVLPAWGATLIKHTNQQGQIQQTLMSGTQARMDSGEPNRYMVLKLDTQTMYAVDAGQKKVLEMSLKADDKAVPQMPNMPNMPEPVKVESALVDQGAGPEMVGYATQRYQITANGEVCSDNYVSKDALELPELQSFLDAMTQLTHSRRAMMKMAMAFSPCLTAQVEQEDALMEKGMVLKSLDGKGTLLHEVTDIETNVEVTPEQFAIPSDYQVMNEQQLMQQRMEQMRQQFQQQQQLQQQQGGQMPAMPAMPAMPQHK